MKKREKTPLLSEAQREIMNIVWDNEEVGVAEVWGILADRRPVARNTVLTLITRLVDKGWLQPRRVGNAFRYTAARPRDEARADEIRRLVDTVFDGSAEGLVMSLLEVGNLSPDESDRIRSMILKANRKSGRDKP
jgi:BlaI family transcriptional regulator, penicillinase repressor